MTTRPVPDPTTRSGAERRPGHTEPPGPHRAGVADALLEPAEPSDEVAVLERELASGDGSRLARYSRRANTAIRLLALIVAGTGLLALAAGLAAWRGEPMAMVVVGLLCLPAVALPAYVTRRAGALADAAGHPREVAAQAQDLVTRVRDSAELRSLAGRLTMRRHHHRSVAGAARTVRTGRVRGAISLARLASTVIGQAAPDAERHPLLVPFTPERLGRTWLAALWSLWAWLSATIVLLVSLVALLVGLF